MASKRQLHASFGNVRKDIVYLSELVAELQIEVEHLRLQVEGSKPKEKQYVASEKGTKAYPADSFHANNIKTDNRIVFNNKKEAIAAGYKI